MQYGIIIFSFINLSVSVNYCKEEPLHILCLAQNDPLGRLKYCCNDRNITVVQKGLDDFLILEDIRTNGVRNGPHFNSSATL